MSKSQHPDSRGFEQVADLYERLRPSYPEEAISWFGEALELGPGKIVLDLGAGTGKLTRQLVLTGARVIAVEPGAEMRARLAAAVPAVKALAGSAEAIPLADASVDAVTAAQAFHWFRVGEAVAEIKRVLRPLGGLALIWNERDPEDPLQRRVTELIAPLVPAARAPVLQAGWRDALEADPAFGPIAERIFRFADALDAREFADRIATISFVAAAPAERRFELERDLLRLAEKHGGRVRFPYRTAAFLTRRQCDQ